MTYPLRWRLCWLSPWRLVSALRHWLLKCKSVTLFHVPPPLHSHYLSAATAAATPWIADKLYSLFLTPLWSICHSHYTHSHLHSLHHILHLPLCTFQSNIHIPTLRNNTLSLHSMNIIPPLSITRIVTHCITTSSVHIYFQDNPSTSIHLSPLSLPLLSSASNVIHTRAIISEL